MSWYKTGQIAVTNGSRVVVGVGTNFTRSVEVGEALLGPDGQHYEITSVPSATELRIGKNYAGPTAANQSYTIVPVQGYVRELAHKAADLIDAHKGVPAEALSHAEAAAQSAAEAQAANIGVKEARDAAAESAVSAAASATAAAGTVSQVADLASQAQTSATAASGSATSASSSKTAAEAAATSATASATQANASKVFAEASATSASTGATAAANSSSQALAHSESAAVSATTARTAADEAVTSNQSAGASATAAGNSATQSQTSATAAEASAGAAASSAVEAAASATAALASKEGAEAVVNTVSEARDAALAHTATAKAWADKVDGEVEPGKYSARYWAGITAGVATGGVVYMGTWGAAGGVFPTNPDRGHLYKVSVAGEIAGESYSVKDMIIFNGESWDKIDSTDEVTSVAGRVGAVLLTKADVDLENVDNTADLAKPVSAAQQAALNQKQDTLVSGKSIKTLNGAPLLGGGDIEISGGVEFVRKTAAVTLADKQGIIADTSGGSFTVKLPASPVEGTQVFINDGANWAVNNLTVDPQGKVIENLAAGESLILNAKGLSVQFLYDSFRWYIYASASGIVRSDYVTRSGATMQGALNWATPVEIASANTTSIGQAASNRVRITGTTTITRLGTTAPGASRTVTFTGALTLTHNATSLILPGGANITTAAGDVAEFESLGSGNWRCTGYMRTNGRALVVPSQATPYADTAAATTAVPYGRYRLTASLDLTLPVSPADGVWVDVVNTSGTTTARVLRNGQNINGGADDVTLDKQWVSLRFVFRTGYGWIIT